ncbi:MAG: exopolyphosphatase [Lachnospiraceae bacterium]|nr:exopolyphosphatase [Lachnospiraceae bacterium]
MAGTTFAAIDVGSYNVSMEIFQISRQSGMKTLTKVRSRVELGRDTYNLKMISLERLQELIEVLKGYQRLMAEYGVAGCRACAKSAFREARNSVVIIDAVYQATGIRIDVLSNSEQRFLGYKAIASKGEDFREFIKESTAIVDLGGGSVQISIFNEDSLAVTQNLMIGSLRLREKLADMERLSRHYDELVTAFVQKELKLFKRLYLKGRKIDNIILVGDYFTNLIFQNAKKTRRLESREQFMDWYDKIMKKSPRQLADDLSVGLDMAEAVVTSAILYRRIIEELGASMIWLPGIELTDGIAYDYANRLKLLKAGHNFDKDVITAAYEIAERYGSDRAHIRFVKQAAEKIFDAMSRGTGLTDRDRLLLRTAAILHSCGCYISRTRSAECSYEIVRSTEIIGLTEDEREMVARLVKYVDRRFDYAKAAAGQILSPERIVALAKLTAILRLANALDQSSTQKAAALSARVRNGVLEITVETQEDFTLENGSLAREVGFFKEVCCMQVTLKQKAGKGRA